MTREGRWFWLIILCFLVGLGTLVGIFTTTRVLYAYLSALVLFGAGLGGLLVFDDLHRGEGKRIDQYLSRTGLDRREYQILYGSALLAVVPVVLLTVYQLPVSVSNSSSTGVATPIAQILAAIFAIIVSVTLLSIEFFSRKLSSRVVQSFIFSRVPLIAGVSYLILIPILLYSAVLFSAGTSSKLSLAAITWCLGCLASYAVFFYRRIDPLRQIEAVRNLVPADFDSRILEKVDAQRITAEDRRDRFIEVPPITRRLIESGDLFVFAKWVEFFFDMEDKYVSKRREMYESGELDRETAYEEIEGIVKYFSRISSEIFQEVKSAGDIRFFLPFFRLSAERITRAIEIENGRNISSLMTNFLTYVMFAIDMGDEYEVYRNITTDVLESYLRKYISLGGFTEFGKKDAKRYEGLWLVYFTEDWAEIRETLIQIVRNQSANQNQAALRFVSRVLQSLLRTVIVTDGKFSLRERLVNQLMYRYNQSYHIAQNADIHFSYCRLQTLYLGVDLDDDQVSLILRVIDEQEPFVVERIREGDGMLSEQIRLNSIRLPEEYPRITNRVMKLLFEAIKADESDSPPLLQPVDIALADKQDVLTKEVKLEAEAILYRYDYKGHRH